jgi:diguanylate cyclase
MSIRILMVDDEPNNLDILRIYLKSLKYDVYEAVCGKDAITMIDKVNPDLILLDVMLPDISGYEVCKQLNNIEDFDIPIIFLSAVTQKDAIIKGLELGVFDYLTKPFDLELLEKKIAIALSHRKNYKHDLYQRLEMDINHVKVHNLNAGFIIFRIDQYELIYNSFGQEIINFVVQSLLVRLRENSVLVNTLSRYNTDKIIAVLFSMNCHEVIKERLTKMMNAVTAQPFLIEGQEIYITVSIGVSLYPEDGDSVHKLLKNAEIAMHTAHRMGGGNQFMLYNKNMEQSLSKRITIESKLRKALERNEFSLNYQPKVDIQSDSIVGTEALLRWHNDDLGNVPPSEFIPIAEEIGLIDDIGKWVLQNACIQNKQWNEMGYPDLTIAVNLSSLQFENSNFLKSVIEILSNTGLEPSLLELEITEGIVMKNPEEAIILLTELKKMGVKISIDDFGTGFSSLSYLKKLPISCLKIDRSFIKDISADTEFPKITNAIISLAHSLNLKVVAEGVEEEKQLTFLKNHNCEEVQGYYFSRPLPPMDLMNFLNKFHQSFNNLQLVL